MKDNFRPFFSTLLETLANENVLALNQNHEYIAFNDCHKSFIKGLTGKEIKHGFNYLDIISPFMNFEKVKTNLDRSLQGMKFSVIEEYFFKDKKEVFQTKYAPVYEDGDIIGSMILSYNITKGKENEKTWQSLLKISEEVHIVQNISELVKLIHNLLSELLYAKNFYICLYDEGTGRYFFPYFIDEYDTIDTSGVGFSYDKKSGIKTYDLSKTITDYVRQTGKPFIYSEEAEIKLYEAGIELYGTPSPSWLGVPLKLMGKTVGVLTVQCYDKLDMYTKKEEDLLVFVSDHISRAIESKRAQERIDEEHQVVLQQKNDILASINYAKYIQSAILPKKEQLDCLLKNYFVILKPQSIVSGDFYWSTNISEKIIIAAVDCTGHGVPGALMSMLGAAFLNEIVNKEYITNPDVILRKLRKEVIRALQQKGEFGEQKDGMDISLCAIDYEHMKLQFAGANNPLYLIRESKNSKLNYENQYEFEGFILYEIKGDRMPISFFDLMDKFTLHEIDIQKGDMIFLFSDGIADQFGGPLRKKLRYKNFKKLLLSNCSKTMEEQKDLFNKALDEWKGDYNQIDDILLIGIKII